ncbi:polyprenyl synthetase family protein [Peptococcaceae bacterium 1198_IL3148]
MTISLQTIQHELSLVDARINKELMIRKSGHAGQFAHLEFSRLDSIIRPALTILVGKMFSFEKNKLVTLASILQLIYMSSQIHANVTESNQEVNDVRDGCQLPVLVGDYLFGKFFTHLSDHDMLEYLIPLAEIICRVNEGATLRNQHSKINVNTSQELLYNIIKMETAELFAGCTSLGAKISGAVEADIKIMYEFGLNFGLGFGLLEQGVSYEYVEKYFSQAENLLKYVVSSESSKELCELLSKFKNNEVLFQRMVG